MERMLPQSADELADNLFQLASSRKRLRLGGAFSKTRLGGAIDDHDVTISTAAIRSVLQFEPKDLTVSVEAGMTWKSFTQLLDQHKMMVPLDPPFSDQATVGGVVASNICGSRRRGYGTARDVVIGMRFATLQGKLVQSGGMVVKNVAGLDMGKLIIGSLGTLAAITSVNFKVSPIAQTRSFLYQSKRLAEVIASRDMILKSTLQPVAIDILNPAAARRVSLGDYCLLLQAAGNTASLDRWGRDLSGFSQVDEALWPGIREFTPRYLQEHAEGCVVRRTSLLTGMSRLLENQLMPDDEVPVIARAGSGVAYAHYPQAVAASDGIIKFAPSHRDPKLDLWPGASPAITTMQKVKQLFDPHQLLNRGRLYGRI